MQNTAAEKVNRRSIKSRPKMSEAPNQEPKIQDALDLPEQEMTPDVPQSRIADANPLARIAGSYADDPNWDEFMQALEESRCELDEALTSAE